MSKLGNGQIERRPKMLENLVKATRNQSLIDMILYKWKTLRKETLRSIVKNVERSNVISVNNKVSQSAFKFYHQKLELQNKLKP